MCDDRELFYRNGTQRMFVVRVKTEPGFSWDAPVLLFDGVIRFFGSPGGSYDVSPDGRRFLAVQAVNPEPPVTQINVVLNWTAELKRLVPTPQ
jgi:hypothetical protein